MTITSYLYYEDVEKALDFLERAFGFQRFGETMKTPEGVVCHAAMKHGDDVVMMGWPGPDYRSPRALGQATFSLYVAVSDVDGHFRRASEAGATILEEPTDTDYGDRRYGAEDREGHQWYFAQRIGQPAEG